MDCCRMGRGRACATPAWALPWQDGTPHCPAVLARCSVQPEPGCWWLIPPAEPCGSSLGPQLPQGAELGVLQSACLHHPRMRPCCSGQDPRGPAALRTAGLGAALWPQAQGWAPRGGSARTHSAPRLRAWVKRVVMLPSPWPWGLLLPEGCRGAAGAACGWWQSLAAGLHLPLAGCSWRGDRGGRQPGKVEVSSARGHLARLHLTFRCNCGLLQNSPVSSTVNYCLLHVTQPSPKACQEEVLMLGCLWCS